MIDLQVIRKYTFEDGTVMHVKIDFENDKVSFVEKSNGGWVNKKMIFADRGLDYMNGWLNILGAMQYVVRQARAELDERNNKKIIEMVHLLAELDVKKGKKK